jgi:hypothetical protein
MALHPVRNLALGVLLSAAAGASLAGTFTVTTTNDDGPGSLRQAILDAGGSGEVSTIVFAIGTGHQRIRPLTSLPKLISSLLDGRTQPGYAGTPLIEVDGSLMAAGGTCFDGVQQSAIDSLVINSCPFAAVRMGVGGTIRRSYVGTDVTGTLARPNAYGVEVPGYIGAPFVVIGGYRPDEGNVISGNGTGVSLVGGGPTFVIGNRIGTDASGMAAIPNQTGIDVQQSGVQIGGPSIWYANLISGNFYGIRVGITSDDGSTVIRNNVIGPDAAGGGAAGTQSVGIDLYQTTGLTLRDNVITRNTTGVELEYISVRDRITRNLIYANGLGIDLDKPNGARTLNDPGDGDYGTNLDQNFPILASGLASSGIVVVSGTLNSEPVASYDVEIFAQKPGGGQIFVGTAAVTTDSNGDGAFAATFVADVTAGDVLTATATDAFGDTSELSDALAAADSTVQVASLSPTSGPASGGTSVTLTGAGFQNDATVAFGATPAASATVNGPTEILTTSPALEPGSVSPVVVTNGDLTAGGIADGFFADFLDVPQGDPFHDAIEALVRSGITAGCGGGNYCAGASVTRAQVAVFLLKAEHGRGWVPPPCRGLFADVPCPSTYADWVERLADEGIAGGCGGGNYCPDDAVRRDQMAPLLLRTEHGPGYAPPACAGVFADVPCPSLFADWIEQLVAESVTAGCGGANYCPDSPNTRGQMAVFLTKTFSLP